MTHASLLAVFAHPDDESLACGGLLALSAERGVRVSLLCLTRGESGPGGDAGELGEIRARELHAAAAALGIDDVRVLEHADGMLPWIAPELLEADILAAVRGCRPDIVVTFDEDGLYWHPDHVAVHQRVTAAMAGLGASAPELWYASVPAGAMRAVTEAAELAGDGWPRILGVDPDAFGAHAPEPTLVVSAGSQARRKLAALRCHRSQVVGSALDRIAEDDAERLLGTEHYRRAPVGRGARGPAAGGSLLERLGRAVATAAPVAGA